MNKDEYFSSPIYHELKKEWVEKLDNLSDPYIKQARDKQKEVNEKRLTGNWETSDINEFSWGVADRYSSVRIPRHVHQNQKGYLEDRRPASNADPYAVCAVIIITTKEALMKL